MGYAPNSKPVRAANGLDQVKVCRDDKGETTG